MKELKNFKLSNKGVYPFNVMACIKGYKEDKNPETIICSIKTHDENDLDLSTLYKERIEDCLNSFPRGVYWSPVTGKHKDMFKNYFIDNASIEELSSDKFLSEDRIWDMIIRVLHALSLDFYTDIIFDDTVGKMYKLEDSIISYDSKLKNCLRRYSDNILFSNDRSIIYLQDIVTMIDYYTNTLLDLDERIDRTFKSVRGIGAIYQNCIKSIYTLCKKYIPEIDTTAVDYDGDKKYPVGSPERYNDFTEEDVVEEIVNDQVEQAAKLTNDIEYCRNKVNLYDTIKSLKLMDEVVTEIDLEPHNSVIYEPMKIKKEILLEALEMLFDAEYK